jgi:hypothetical protein
MAIERTSDETAIDDYEVTNTTTTTNRDDDSRTT